MNAFDLNNVPLVSGTSYVKWHLPSSTSAEHRGHTSKAVIRDHKVAWDYVKTLPVRLTVDRSGMLQESEIHFEVLQEYSPGTRAERIVLGNVKLNLAEFVGGSDDGEDAVTRRYLMQESKINSTLKLEIMMTQTEGSRDFIAPPLKTAPVFGGIAGIMTAESGDPSDDGNNVPSMSYKARESGKLQDMYRRTLAASWAAQAGELPADKCIENIFAGGDGWGEDANESPKPSPRVGGGSTEDDSESETRTLRGHKRNTSGTGSRSTLKPTLRQRTSSKEGPTTGTVSGRGSIAQQIQQDHDSKSHAHRTTHEVNEFTEREDLRSWEISAKG
ncbi:hypothetical protein P7C71_g3752, partial [Lecanoromycetidae sp. Uapishka_2]